MSVEEAGQASLGRKPRAPDVDKLRAELEDYMQRQGLRSTEQRRVIIDAFFESTEHLTIDQLLERARSHDSRIGYATVYRTMKMLSEGGVAHERNFEDGVTRYELADSQSHHDHLICQVCGRITEFEEPLIEELQDRIAARYGFVVTHHKHELYGHCEDPGRCPNNPRAARRPETEGD